VYNQINIGVLKFGLCLHVHASKNGCHKPEIMFNINDLIIFY
jgi:hypothetical protein